jgi:hypothetical protein
LHTIGVFADRRVPAEAASLPNRQCSPERYCTQRYIVTRCCMAPTTLDLETGPDA